MSIPPSVWGPNAWIFIHNIAFGYPDSPSPEIQQQYETFFTYLQYVLPCSKCRTHFKQNLEKHPIKKSLHSREALIKWTIDIHNEVNKINNKPMLSYNDAKNIYDISNKQSYTKIYIIGIIVIMIFILFCIKVGTTKLYALRRK